MSTDSKQRRWAADYRPVVVNEQLVSRGLDMITVAASAPDARAVAAGMPMAVLRGIADRLYVDTLTTSKAALIRIVVREARA